MLCAIWYHLYNLKNAKNIHGRAILFSTFFKLCKRYQTVQSIIYIIIWDYMKNPFCLPLQVLSNK